MTERMSRALLAALLALTACDLVDPERPIQHQDTEVFGNLIDVTRLADEGVWSARIQVGMPRSFVRAEAEEGKPTPTLEKGITADVRITADTIVIVDGQSGFIEDISPGTEVVVVPVAGTTSMMGTSNLSVEASLLADFVSFRRWRLPGLEGPRAVSEARTDPDRINSDGVERSPVPLAGGSVLYFTAGLRPPARSGEGWLGARRPGLEEPEAEGIAAERPYRTELGGSGWSAPAPVVLGGIGAASSVSVTWVSEDETACLVTVSDQASSWVGTVSRASAREPWGQVQPLPGLDDRDAGDAAYLAGSRTKVVFAARRTPGTATDLWLYDASAEQTILPLEPVVNSSGPEWGPRVGPDNELFFVRGDRQFVLEGRTLHAVTLPRPHRTVVTEAAPTGDGRWVFLCIPWYRPVELDQDIYVAEWLGAGRLGEVVPADEWRP